MNKRIFAVLGNRKYEILLAALIAHLYIGIFLTDLVFYTRVVWPVNMAVLGLASATVFVNAGTVRKMAQRVLWIIAFLLPVTLPFFGQVTFFMVVLSVFYCLFFGIIFIEVIRFLVRPSYINTDIISAAACGYFLLIEIIVFLLQSFYYQDASVLTNMSGTRPAEIYMDLVYFSSVTITSIGYGDISPNTHAIKLIVSLFGVVSQFYSVVLVGILISKFTSAQDAKH